MQKLLLCVVSVLLLGCSERADTHSADKEPAICVSDRYIMQFSERMNLEVGARVGNCFSESVLSDEPVTVAANFIGSMQRNSQETIRVHVVDDVVYCCLIHDHSEEEFRSFLSLLHGESRVSQISGIAAKQARKILGDNGIDECTSCGDFAQGNLVSGLELDLGALCEESGEIRALIGDLEVISGLSFSDYLSAHIVSDLSGNSAVREALSRAEIVPCEG